LKRGMKISKNIKRVFSGREVICKRLLVVVLINDFFNDPLSVPIEIIMVYVYDIRTMAGRVIIG